MRFIDDDDGGFASGDEIGEGGSEGGDLSSGTKGRLLIERQKQAAIQRGGRGDGGGQLNEDMAVGIEGGKEGADGCGFAGADIAGDEADAALFDDKVEASDEFLEAGSDEHIWGGNSLGKGGGFEAEELLIHDLGLLVRGQIRELDGANLFAHSGIMFVAQTRQKV